MADEWTDAKTVYMVMCPCGSTMLCGHEDGGLMCPACLARYTNAWIQIEKTPHDGPVPTIPIEWFEWSEP